ncbi:MAG TPA: four helix bundle protein [Gemmataceae bacterium]|nr:four helix bundle protein [Gemmataceae bacterium]
MSIELPVIRACYQLALELARRVEKFPRHQRMALGADLTALARGVIDRLVRAKYARPGERAPLLRDANANLEVLRFQLRLAADLKALPYGGHEYLLRLAHDVGTQVRGWLRSLPGRGPGGTDAPTR